MSTPNQAASTNKATVHRYLDGIRTSNVERILSCLTDDIEWTVFGMRAGLIAQRRAWVIELKQDDWTDEDEKGAAGSAGRASSVVEDPGIEPGKAPQVRIPRVAVLDEATPSRGSEQTDRMDRPPA